MRHVTSPRNQNHGQRHTLDAEWSIQNALYHPSPDPDDEDSDGFPYGPRRDIKPGNTAKFFLTADGPLNRTAVPVLQHWWMTYIRMSDSRFGVRRKLSLLITRQKMLQWFIL